ncbi:hypothetical protein FZN37_004345 [Enterobacter hormaechei]|nr:hypothetical protein FZN37_004345 [Enterobacter hormaechei]
MRAVGAAHMQMQHRGAGIHALACAGGQFVGRERQCGMIGVRLARTVGRNGDGDGPGHHAASSALVVAASTASPKRSTMASMS